MNAQHGIGYRSVEGGGGEDVAGRLHASPTGRRLAIDGTFVFTYTNTDPETAYLTASDGAAWLYEDLATGNRFFVTFTRDSGFKSVQVT